MRSRCDLLLTNALVVTMDEQFQVHETGSGGNKACCRSSSPSAAPAVITPLLERLGARGADIVDAAYVDL